MKEGIDAIIADEKAVLKAIRRKKYKKWSSDDQFSLSLLDDGNGIYIMLGSPYSKNEHQPIPQIVDVDEF